MLNYEKNITYINLFALVWAWFGSRGERVTDCGGLRLIGSRQRSAVGACWPSGDSQTAELRAGHLIPVKRYKFINISKIC